MTLFAFGFGVPAMLGGLAAAGIPLLIHLLRRQRYRVTDWAAMEWLLAALKQNRRRMQFEQWLLLLLRTLLIVLVVLAMAKPALEGNAGGFLVETPATHNILVFDNSFSMHYQDAAGSRWQRAKDLSQSILDDTQKGDLASLLVLGGPQSVLVGDPSPYLATVGELVDGLTRRDGVARLDTVLDPLTRLLQDSPSGDRRVYLITDMQRSTWLGAGEDADPGDLGEKLRAVSGLARVRILDVGSANSDNHAVTELAADEPVVTMNRSAVFHATVANYGSKPLEDAPLSLHVDGIVEAQERVSVDPGATARVNFAVTLKSPGYRVLEARLPADDLPGDDARPLAVDVREALRVLLIDGEPSGEPFRSERDYLDVALQPESGDLTSALIRTEYRLESDLAETRLDDWDLVVLLNVGRVTSNEATVLEDYLRRGGGLLFFLGSQVDLEAYDRVLYQNGEGPLPLELRGLVGTPAPTGGIGGGDDFYRFDPLDYQHPILEAFRDNERAGLLGTKVYRYVAARLPEESTARVALAYGDGMPAIVVGEFGRGRVGVVTTSADLDWNTWPLSPSYLPVMQELTRYLVGGRMQRDVAVVGEPLTLALPREAIDIAASVTPPGDESDPVPATVGEEEGVPVLTYEDPERAGVYTATLGPPLDTTIPLAVATAPDESDLTRLTEDDLRSLFPGFQFEMDDRYVSVRQMLVTGDQGRGEIHKLLLYAALALAFVETFLAWKFAHHTG